MSHLKTYVCEREKEFFCERGSILEGALCREGGEIESCYVILWLNQRRLLCDPHVVGSVVVVIGVGSIRVNSQTVHFNQNYEKNGPFVVNYERIVVIYRRG